MKFFNSLKNRIPKTNLYEELPSTPQRRDVKIGGWVSGITAFYEPGTVKDYIDLLIKDGIASGNSDEDVFRGITAKFESDVAGFEDQAVNLNAYRDHVSSGMGAVGIKAFYIKLDTDPISVRIDFENWAGTAGPIEQASMVVEPLAA